MQNLDAFALNAIRISETDVVENAMEILYAHAKTSGTLRLFM